MNYEYDFVAIHRRVKNNDLLSAQRIVIPYFGTIRSQSGWELIVSINASDSILIRDNYTMVMASF